MYCIYNFIDAALQKVTKMSTSLSYDRRAIDEDQAADFLAVLKAMLEDPSFLIAGRLRALRYAQDWPLIKHQFWETYWHNLDFNLNYSFLCY